MAYVAASFTHCFCVSGQQRWQELEEESLAALLELAYEEQKKSSHNNHSRNKGKNKKRLPRGTKTFVDYRSGLQKGWSEEGLFVFNMIYKEVKKRREESKELEEMMRQRFIKESNGNQQQKHRNGRSKQYKNVEIEMSEDLKNMFEKRM